MKYPWVMGQERRFTKPMKCLRSLSLKLSEKFPGKLKQQMQDNITWIKGAQENNLVVGSSKNFGTPMQKEE